MWVRRAELLCTADHNVLRTGPMRLRLRNAIVRLLDRFVVWLFIVWLFIVWLFIVCCSSGGCSSGMCNSCGQRFVPGYAAAVGYAPAYPMAPVVEGTGSCGCNSNGAYQQNYQPYYQPSYQPVGSAPNQMRMVANQRGVTNRAMTADRRGTVYRPVTAHQPATAYRSAMNGRTANSATSAPAYRTARTYRSTPSYREVSTSDLQFERGIAIR